MASSKLPTLCLLLFFTAPNIASGAVESGGRRVLIVSAGSRIAPGFMLVDQHLLQVLGNIPSVQVEVHAENLDLVRFPADRSQRIFTEYLGAKYAENPPDLIILVYVGNLGILGKILSELFPRVPIVATGFTEEPLQAGEFGSTFTGLAHRVNPRATLELMRRLQPELRRVIVVGGTAETDRLVLDRVKEAAQVLGGQIEVDIWDHLTVPQLPRALSELPPNTAVLFGRFFRDSAGQPVISSTIGQQIAQWANAPVYVMTGTSIGSGAVGGSVVNIEAFAKRAGEMARLILTGTDVRSIPLEIRTDSVPTFDWRALQRWGIPESRLPPDSVVRFRQPSTWEEYRWHVLIVVIIIALQSALIGDLLLQRSRRRRAEESLSESRQFTELATEAGGVGLWVRDLAAGTLWANPRLLSFFGLSEAKTHDVSDFLSRIHPEDLPQVTTMIEEGGETDQPFHVEFRTLPEEGVTRWFAATGRLTQSADGKSQRRMGTVVDVTARKLFEERLWESEYNFRLLVETTSAVMWQAEFPSGMFTYVGPQALQLLGYPLAHWYETDFWTSHVHADDLQEVLKARSAMLDEARAFDLQYRMLKTSGEIVWIHEIASCEEHDGKRALRGLMLDITERKHAEQAIRESEERFRSVANAAPVMIWMSDAARLCTFFNKGWIDFTGRALEQDLGNGWMECVHKEDLDRWHGSYHKAFDARQEYTLEYRLRRHDGAYRWVVSHGVPRPEADGTFLGYIGTVIDITQRKEAEDALRQERRFLRQVIDTLPNFVYAKDRQGRFTLANRAVADAHGTTVEALVGKTDADFNGNQKKLEVDFSRNLEQEVIDTRQERVLESEQITDARGKVRWLQTVRRPIIESDGSAMQVLGISTDITQIKKAEMELREQRAELAHAGRMSTMGELAASLAHELNQPLTAILSNAQAAQRFLSAKPSDIKEVREILHDIVEDNKRAGEVIRRMRALVKKENIEFSLLDLHLTIHEIVSLLHSDAVLRNVRVGFDLDRRVSQVRGDKVQLQQVLLNLLLNAFDAMKDCPAGERDVRVRTELDGDCLVRTSVSDRGTGLTSEQLDKIFQPFYTTKGEGLGMGLSICRSIVEAHGGHLWAENNPDHGATFCFTVPLAGEEQKKAETKRSHEGV